MTTTPSTPHPPDPHQLRERVECTDALPSRSLPLTLHGHLRGNVSLRPAAERAADPDHHVSVADDVTEQTIDANDAMAIEERQHGAAADKGADAERSETREAESARGGAAEEAADGGAAGDATRAEGDFEHSDEGLEGLGAFGVFG